MTGDTLTVIVVTRNLAGLLAHCLHALRAAIALTPVREHHVVVVDNGSEVPYHADTLGDMVNVLRFDVGTSFSAANNRAAREWPSDFYLLLNNDVFLSPRALADMFRAMNEHAGAGICGTRLLFPDGTMQHCGVAFGAGARGPYHHLRKNLAHVASRGDREWQAVTGACMLVRATVWQELGGLDEAYPFGLEDIDFCLRAVRGGCRVYCCNGTDSLHFESFTPGRVELDVSSRRLFSKRWRGRYLIDG